MPSAKTLDALIDDYRDGLRDRGGYVLEERAELRAAIHAHVRQQIEQEREACAQIVDAADDGRAGWLLNDIASDIRDRSTPQPEGGE